MGVQSRRQRPVAPQRLPPAVVGDLHDVRQGDVGQRIGRRVRYRARHVGDAVEDRVVHPVGRVGVRRGLGVLETAALVDRDVDEHRARLHPRDELVRDQHRRLRPGHEHRSDDQVGVDHRPLDFVRVRGDSLAVALVDGISGTQPGHVLVDEQHLRLHPERDRGRVHARHARAKHDDLRRVHPGHAAHEHAPATAVTLQMMRSDLGCHPSGHLGHRREQRQRPVRQLHGLVGDRGDTR